MKRIILISLVSLALFGFGEKKVTEEMLIGEWQCAISFHGENWIEDDFQERELIQAYKGNVKFFKKNNILYINFENEEPHPFQLETYFNGKEQVTSNKDENIKQQKTINYFSHDKFKTTISSEYTLNDLATYSQKIDIEMTCERIKE